MGEEEGEEVSLSAIPSERFHQNTPPSLPLRLPPVILQKHLLCRRCGRLPPSLRRPLSPTPSSSAEEDGDTVAPADGLLALSLDVDVRPQVGGSLALKKKPKTVEAGGGQVVAVSRRANSKCHSAAAPRDGSQSVGTLTRNQRKLDFNCREYKVLLSRPRCRLLLLLFFFFLSAAALQLSEPPHQHHPLPPLPLCAWRTHQNCLCPKYSRWISTLLLRSRSLCSRDGAAFALVLAALGELRLWPLLPFEFMRPSLTTKTGNGTLPGGCVFFCCC